MDTSDSIMPCTRSLLLVLYWLALPPLITSLITPVAATAGAWKRPVGEGFSSTSATLRHTKQGALLPEFSYYRDFGVTPRFDLGIDINQSGTASGSQSGHALFFVRLPLREGPEITQIAAELALGTNYADRLWHPMYRITLSAGRGFTSALGNGWGNLDLILEQRGNAAHPLWKFDGTFGLSSGRRVNPLISFETAFGPGGTFAYSITPALRIDLNTVSLWGKQPFDNADLTVGLEYRQADRQSLGIKIALWQRF